MPHLLHEREATLDLSCDLCHLYCWKDSLPRHRIMFRLFRLKLFGFHLFFLPEIQSLMKHLILTLYICVEGIIPVSSAYKFMHMLKDMCS